MLVGDGQPDRVDAVCGAIGWAVDALLSIQSETDVGNTAAVMFARRSAGTR